MTKYIHPLFPSILVETECEDFHKVKSKLTTWIYSYKSKEDVNGISRSNRGGWHSSNDLHLYEPFFQFRDYILFHINQSLDFYDLEYTLTSMWINLNKKGDYNVSHDHPDSDLSGVFWVKIPQNSGNLTFYSQKSFMEHKLIENIDENLAKTYNYYGEVEFSPKEGSMVLFPSHILHDVEPNESEDDRISISFNLKC